MSTEVLIVDGRVSPFAVVNKKEVDAAINARNGKSDEELKTERTEIFKRLEKGFEESDNGKDYSKTAAFGDGTPVEKMTRCMEAHADYSAVGHILAHREAIQATAEDVLLENQGGGPQSGLQGIYGHPLPMYGVPGQHAMAFGERVIALAKKAGTPFNYSPQDKANRFDVSINLRQGQWPEVFGATFKTTAGFPPFVTREREIVPSVVRRRTFWDVLRKYMTNQAAVKYMQQTMRMNAAAPIAEEGAAPESRIEYTEQTVNINRIPTILPVTEEQLADADEVMALIDMDLADMVLEAAELQALNGDGAAPNWRGLLQTANVQDFALVAENNIFTQLLKDVMHAMALVETNAQTMPTDLVLHPRAWAKLATEEPAQGGGLYLGNPAEGFMPQVWGLPVAKSTAFPYEEDAPLGVVGNFMRWISVPIRQDVQIESGLNADNFRKFVVSLRASLRGGLKVTRPQAFVKLNWTAS